MQGKIPCQVIVNNLNVDDVPTKLGNLKKTGTNNNCTAQIIFGKKNNYAQKPTKEN